MSFVVDHGLLFLGFRCSWSSRFSTEEVRSWYNLSIAHGTQKMFHTWGHQWFLFIMLFWFLLADHSAIILPIQSYSIQGAAPLQEYSEHHGLLIPVARAFACAFPVQLRHLLEWTRNTIHWRFKSCTKYYQGLYMRAGFKTSLNVSLLVCDPIKSHSLVRFTPIKSQWLLIPPMSFRCLNKSQPETQQEPGAEWAEHFDPQEEEEEEVWGLLVLPGLSWGNSNHLNIGNVQVWRFEYRMKYIFLGNAWKK